MLESKKEKRGKGDRKWNGERKSPKPEKGNWHTGTRSTENPKQEELKENHTKIYDNEKGKVKGIENYKGKKRKTIIYKGILIKLSDDFSAEIL